MPFALSRTRSQRYIYPIGGIARWRPVATIAGMDAKDRKIEQLQRVIAEQAATIEKLVQRVDQLERKLAAANKDSSNSSKPPSIDIVKKSKGKGRGKQKGNRKPGGQKGRPRSPSRDLPAHSGLSCRSQSPTRRCIPRSKSLLETPSRRRGQRPSRACDYAPWGRDWCCAVSDGS